MSNSVLPHDMHNRETTGVHTNYARNAPRTPQSSSLLITQATKASLKRGSLRMIEERVRLQSDQTGTGELLWNNRNPPTLCAACGTSQRYCRGNDGCKPGCFDSRTVGIGRVQTRLWRLSPDRVIYSLGNTGILGEFDM